MKQEEDKFTGLPENAFRELKPGEVYNPLMAPSKSYPEVNIWSVAWGIAMAILFSAAAAYLGLKVPRRGCNGKHPHAGNPFKPRKRAGTVRYRLYVVSAESAVGKKRR